jgi:hypothetical protein
MNHDHIGILKHIADAGAALVALGTISAVLPPLASLFTIIWLAIRIYESRTVQRLLYRKTK